MGFAASALRNSCLTSPPNCRVVIQATYPQLDEHSSFVLMHQPRHDIWVSAAPAPLVFSVEITLHRLLSKRRVAVGLGTWSRPGDIMLAVQTGELSGTTIYAELYQCQGQWRRVVWYCNHQRLSSTVLFGGCLRRTAPAVITLAASEGMLALYKDGRRLSSCMLATTIPMHRNVVHSFVYHSAKPGLPHEPLGLTAAPWNMW